MGVDILTRDDEIFNEAARVAGDLHRRFIDEVIRLVKSGGFDTEKGHASILFRVALENVSEGFCLPPTMRREYYNLRRF